MSIRINLQLRRPPPPPGLFFSAGLVPASPRTDRPAVSPSVVAFSGFARIKEVNTNRTRTLRHFSDGFAFSVPRTTSQAVNPAVALFSVFSRFRELNLRPYALEELSNDA